MDGAAEWRLYYGDGSVIRGRTAAEWASAPARDVQVLVVMQCPALHRRRWSGVSDRLLWTGDDEYSLNGWAVKYGAWMTRAAYDAIWERACGDD